MPLAVWAASMPNVMTTALSADATMNAPQSNAPGFPALRRAVSHAVATR
jgi:hypothetical protein